jgi:hypothetical protein
MSDLSHPHCKNCGQPDYACDCEDEYEEVPAAINWLLRDEDIPDDHPFIKARARSNAERIFMRIGELVNGQPAGDALEALTVALSSVVILMTKNQTERTKNVEAVYRSILATVRNER